MPQSFRLWLFRCRCGHLGGDVHPWLQPGQLIADGADHSTGFVVDDAIVMIENISRYIEAGDPPMEAALKGANKLGSPFSR